MLDVLVRTIDISGVSKAKLLMELYNNAKFSDNLSITVGKSKNTISKEEAQDHIDKATRELSLYFYCLGGKVLNIDLSDNDFEPYRYDRIHGDGAAATIINGIKANPEPEMTRRLSLAEILNANRLRSNSLGISQLQSV